MWLMMTVTVTNKFLRASLGSNSVIFGSQSRNAAYSKFVTVTVIISHTI